MSEMLLLSRRHRCCVTLISPTNRRGLHLLHHMFTRWPIGKLASVRKRPLPPPKETKLNLYASNGSNLGETTLEDAFTHIKPLTYLAQVETVGQTRSFRIRPLRKSSVGADADLKRSAREPKPSREFHLTTDVSSDYLGLVIQKSHMFVLKGARVEFSLRQKSRGAPSATIDWALQNRPDVRPDTILRAMPEGTEMLAHPCVDSEQRADRNVSLQWAVDPGKGMKNGAVSTPGWMKEMGTWDVELKLDPSQGIRQPVQRMFNYSKSLSRGVEQSPHKGLKRPYEESEFNSPKVLDTLLDVKAANESIESM